uniref:Ubiquitin carboxyl-terminal hydrolase 15 n=1 Tax=Denticeps clupeoides TaxID=299321 RepID=A0AAY4DF69_9TELE
MEADQSEHGAEGKLTSQNTVVKGNCPVQTQCLQCHCRKVVVVFLSLSGDLLSSCRYLVDSYWFKQWKKYVGFDSWDKYQMGDQNVYPGPVDNAGLLRDGDVMAIKEHLIDELDYVLVPTEGWNKLVSWYGLTDGQEPIARKVRGPPGVRRRLLPASFSPSPSATASPPRPPAHTIEKEMRKLFSIPDEREIRLWNKYMTNTFEPLNKPDSTIQDAGLYQGQVTTPHTPHRHSERAGLCGLSNLGNTCFMNSGTQCLSNIPPLTEYFLKDKYKEELNEDNPLGMKGEIAKAYAELIKQLWSGKFSYVTPRPFKTQVGRFAPQFSGYQQQDSHEFLAFLLDGLHEDLNRIRKKPYIQLKDADGRPDKVVAEEAWENHIKRNDSIIVDIFHGLFKSTLVCPVCAKVSVTFDPFCYLTLPLPMKKERTLEVFLVQLDPLVKPTQYKLTVPKVGYISDLCTSLSALSDVPAERMIVTDIYNHRFHRIFATNENLSSIMERDDIYVAVNRQENSDHVVIPVHLREKYKQSGYNHSSTPLFGQPFLVTVPRTLSEDKFYNMLLHRLRYQCSASPRLHLDARLASLTRRVSSSRRRPSRFASTRDTCGSAVSAARATPPSLLANVSVHDSNHAFFYIFPSIDRSYLSLDWEPEIKKRYFDESVTEDCDKHESMEYKPQKKAVFKLRDCIELFTTKEKLGADDPWYCPSCKQHQQATKKLDLWSLPPVLVVHLKRFSYSRYMRDKLDSLVDFPLRDLDMSEFLINPNAGPCLYDLIAVSNHYGGMGGGHYTAYSKNKDDGKWFYYDDSSVSPASEDQIVSKAAYVLFYQRQDTVKGTGYFVLDREDQETSTVEAGTAQSEEEDEDEEDLNDNEDEDTEPNHDTTMSTN